MGEIFLNVEGEPSKVYAGTRMKDGKVSGPHRQEVTMQVLGAVVSLLQGGGNIDLYSEEGTNPSCRITVESLPAKGLPERG